MIAKPGNVRWDKVWCRYTDRVTRLTHEDLVETLVREAQKRYLAEQQLVEVGFRQDINGNWVKEPAL